MASLSFGTGAHGASGSLQRLRVRRAGMAATVVLVLALAAGAFLRFSHQPAMPSAAAAAAPTDTDATRATDLREGLVAHLVRNPRDARSLILLARLDFSHDRFADAADAYRRAIAVNAKADSDPGIWCEYADALGMAQGGSLAGEPRAIVLRTLARTPGFPRALEMAGSAAFEAREFADAGRYWRELATQLPEEAPARRELAAAAERATSWPAARGEVHRGATVYGNPLPGHNAANEPRRLTMKRYRMAALLTLSCAALSPLAQSTEAPAASAGALLYQTHCIGCHDQKVHWRDRKLVTDWTSLDAQVRRWQANTGLRWSDANVEDVVRYLNSTIYKFPEQAPRQTG